MEGFFIKQKTPQKSSMIRPWFDAASRYWCIFMCLHTPGTWSHNRCHYPNTPFVIEFEPWSSLWFESYQEGPSSRLDWLTAYCFITMAAGYRQLLTWRFNPTRIAHCRHQDSIRVPSDLNKWSLTTWLFKKAGCVFHFALIDQSCEMTQLVKTRAFSNSHESLLG